MIISVRTPGDKEGNEAKKGIEGRSGNNTKVNVKRILVLRIKQVPEMGLENS